MSLLRWLFSKGQIPSDLPTKIEVFSRHCLFSSISQHKKRPLGFSREICYNNLLETFDPTLANLTFFLDTKLGKKDDHFLSQEMTYPVLEIQEGNEAGSFLSLLEHVEKRAFHPETILYFVEDDYLHKEGWTRLLLEAMAIPGVDYATLYDHRDKYFLPMYGRLVSHIFATKSCHWRTTPSTTNTFAVKYKTLKKHLAIHRKFSKRRTISADHEKFLALKKSGAVLVSSIPGFSTHAEPEFASPCTDWENYFKESELCQLQDTLP